MNDALPFLFDCLFTYISLVAEETKFMIITKPLGNQKRSDFRGKTELSKLKHSAEKMSVYMASSIGVAAAGIAADNKGLALTGAALAAVLVIQKPNSRTAKSEILL